jgi:hypothetical protein
MSSIAFVRPDMIYALFGGQSSTVSPCGQYSVRLFDGVTRTWQYVIVDDLLPFYDGKLAYLQSKNEVHNQQVWSALLEKAVAKLVGGYSEYEGKIGGECLSGTEFCFSARRRAHVCVLKVLWVTSIDISMLKGIWVLHLLMHVVYLQFEWTCWRCGHVGRRASLSHTRFLSTGDRHRKM